MTSTYFIITALAACLSAALTFFLLWHRRYNKKESLFAHTMADNKRCLDKTLAKLNSKILWEETPDTITGHFDFQSGHFSVRLEKESPYVRLSYFFFFSASTNDIELVRCVCNLCNLNTETSRVVYTENEKEGLADVHIVCTLLLENHTAYEAIERALNNIFNWQNVFLRKFNELKSENDKSPTRDSEKDHAQYIHELELTRELEMMHQGGHTNWHFTTEKPMLLGSMVTSVMGINEIIPAKLSVTIDDKVTTFDGPDDILAYDTSCLLISEGQFVRHSASAVLAFYDPQNPVKQRHLMLFFSNEGATKRTLYYRVTMSLLPVSTDIATHADHQEHHLQTASVLLGYDLIPQTERLSRFKYMWKEAVSKQEAGETQDMTDDEKLLAGLKSHDIAYYFQMGRSLYQERRFYEGALHLQRAFRLITQQNDTKKPQQNGAIVDVAYYLGCCYLHLQQYERACYYLQFTLAAHNITYTKAYINCLVNSNDFRAMDIIDSLLTDMQEVLDHNNEARVGFSQQQIESFISFMKRRKAYLLVSKQRYDDAVPLLKSLLDDPKYGHFALHQLAFIQKQKKKEAIQTKKNQ